MQKKQEIFWFSLQICPDLRLIMTWQWQMVSAFKILGLSTHHCWADTKMRFSPFIVLLHDKWNFQTFYSNEIGKFPWCCGLVASGKDILAVEFSRWTSIKTIKFWISCTSKICHFFWTYWLLRTFFPFAWCLEMISYLHFRSISSH